MHLPRPLLAFTFAAALLTQAGRAQPTHATWTGATSSNWNDGTNWTPMNIPAGTTSDTATFNAASGSNSITSIGFSLASLTFTSDALANTITASGSMDFYGAGIVNASSALQTLVANGNISFNNSSSAGSATITNNGTVTFSQNTTAASAAITNNGTLRFQFGATAGSATITNNGTMTFSINATSASAAVTNGASGTVDFTNGPLNQSLGSLAGGGTILMGYGDNLTVGSLNTSTTFSGVLDDGGSSSSLTKVGTGALTLSGINNYAGGTTVNGGLIEFASADNFGSGLITLDGGGLRWATGNNTDVTAWSQLNHTIGAGGATFDTNGNNLTFATGLSGAGAFTKAGAGRIILTAANTYTGGTNVNGGSLRLAGGGALGSGAVDVASGAILWFLDSTTAGSASIANRGSIYFDLTTTAGSAAITGSGFVGFYDDATAGTATINTTGNIDFQHNSTASSATITTYGRLSFIGDSSAGSATITNHGNMTLRGDSPASATITNHNILALYSTGGTPTITNHFDLFLLDNADAAGASITNGAAGAILLFSLSSAGTSVGALAGSGEVYLGTKTLTVGARNLSTVFSGVIKESGSLVKTGTGTLTLAADNTYTGTTTVNAGTLRLGAHSALGSGGLILAGGTLDLANFSQTAGPLNVTGPVFIDFGSLSSSLLLADSSALSWSGTLTILNFTNGVDFFRVGTDASGLTVDQLGQINFDGFNALVDSAGYLTAGTTAIPEPSTHAVILGAIALGLVVRRRRLAA